MAGNERLNISEHNLSFGETLFVAGPSDVVIGSAASFSSDGELESRIALMRSNQTEIVTVGSDYILTTWNSETGKLLRLTSLPPLTVYSVGTPQLYVRFDDLEPRVSVQKSAGPYEFTVIPDGLLYEGRIETEVPMDYGKRAAISPALFVPPLSVSVDQVAGEPCVAVNLGHGRVDRVNIARPVYRVTFAPIIRLLDRPQPSNEEWCISVADEIKKLRYQIIESVTAGR